MIVVHDRETLDLILTPVFIGEQTASSRTFEQVTLTWSKEGDRASGSTSRLRTRLRCPALNSSFRSRPLLTVPLLIHWSFISRSIPNYTTARLDCVSISRSNSAAIDGIHKGMYFPRQMESSALRASFCRQSIYTVSECIKVILSFSTSFGSLWKAFRDRASQGRIDQSSICLGSQTSQR